MITTWVEVAGCCPPTETLKGTVIQGCPHPSPPKDDLKKQELGRKQ